MLYHRSHHPLSFLRYPAIALALVGVACAGLMSVSSPAIATANDWDSTKFDQAMGNPVEFATSVVELSDAFFNGYLDTMIQIIIAWLIIHTFFKS